MEITNRGHRQSAMKSERRKTPLGLGNWKGSCHLLSGNLVHARFLT